VVALGSMSAAICLSKEKTTLYRKRIGLFTTLLPFSAYAVAQDEVAQGQS